MGFYTMANAAILRSPFFINPEKRMEENGSALSRYHPVLHRYLRRLCARMRENVRFEMIEYIGCGITALFLLTYLLYALLKPENF